MSRCLICGCTDEQACPGGCSWYIIPNEVGNGPPFDSVGVCNRCKDFTKEIVTDKIMAAIDMWSDVKEELIKVDNLKISLAELIKVL